MLSLSLGVNAFQKTQKSLNGLTGVYGYVAGQEATLNRIKSLFPELKSDVEFVQLEVETVYPNIKSKTSSKIIELAGAEGESMLSLLDKKIQEFSSNELTKANAIRFLSTVRSRSAGNIENPETKMFLLAINNFDNPVSEMSSNKIVKFNTKSEEKAKGIELSISLPSSWEERQGNTPNTVRTWTSEAGSGLSFISLLVLNSDDFMNKNIIKSRIESKNLQGLVPPNLNTLNIFQTDVSNQPGWMFTAEVKTKRLENEIFMNLKTLNVFYKGKIIQLSCTSGGPLSDIDDIKKEFRRTEGVCKYVHNSFIIDSVFK